MSNLAVGVAGVTSLVALISLGSKFTEPGGPHEIVHNLEAWVSTMGYNTALIILAAAAVVYLARKK